MDIALSNAGILTAGMKADILSAMFPPEETPAADALRQALRYSTQEEMASRLHVTSRTIRRWLVAGDRTCMDSSCNRARAEPPRPTGPVNPSFKLITFLPASRASARI